MPSCNFRVLHPSSKGRICDSLLSCSPERPEFSVLVPDEDFKEGCKTPLRPELSSTLKTVLELRALRFDGPTTDRPACLGFSGVVHMVFVVLKVAIGAIDGRDGFRVLTRGLSHKFCESFQ